MWIAWKLSASGGGVGTSNGALSSARGAMEAEHVLIEPLPIDGGLSPRRPMEACPLGGSPALAPLGRGLPLGGSPLLDVCGESSSRGEQVEAFFFLQACMTCLCDLLPNIVKCACTVLTHIVRANCARIPCKHRMHAQLCMHHVQAQSACIICMHWSACIMCMQCMRA